MKTHKLPLSTFDLKSKTQVRDKLDKSAVSAYAQALKASPGKSPFPPPELFLDKEGDYHPASGFHRVTAMKEAGLTETEFVIRNGTKLDAIKHGITENRANGVRMTGPDIAKGMDLLFEVDPASADLSNGMLAVMFGCSEWTIREYRPAIKSPATRLGADGKKRSLPKPKDDDDDIELDEDGNEKPRDEKPKAGKNGKNSDEKNLAKSFKDDKVSAEIDKIADTLGERGLNANGIRKALKNGTVKATSKELAALSGCKPERMEAIWRVMVENNWAPARAISLIDETIDEKTRIETLIALTTKNPDHKPVVNVAVNGYLAVMVYKAKWKLTENKDGGFTVSPK